MNTQITKSGFANNLTAQLIALVVVAAVILFVASRYIW